MTDINEQELAEFWLSKVPEIDGGWRRDNGHTAWVMFHTEASSPIIAHLIQEFMEVEGFTIEYKKKPELPSGHFFKYSRFSNDFPVGHHIDKNKWIANAEAARKALGK